MWDNRAWRVRHCSVRERLEQRWSGDAARRSDVDSDALKGLLIEHTDAWNSHDIDRLMSLFADDCVFEAAGGPESHGRRFVGRAQVRTAFADVFDSMPDANWDDGRHFVISDGYGVSEWRLTGTLLDGSRIDVFGCDFLTVRDDKIVRKSSFRKQRPPVSG
jgi:taurine dehydrogenase small subunit